MKTFLNTKKTNFNAIRKYLYYFDIYVALNVDFLQCSHLGSVLFTFYINDLPMSIPRYICKWYHCIWMQAQIPEWPVPNSAFLSDIALTDQSLSLLIVSSVLWPIIPGGSFNAEEGFHVYNLICFLLWEVYYIQAKKKKIISDVFFSWEL